jgi:hypothetical protein
MNNGRLSYFLSGILTEMPKIPPPRFPDRLWQSFLIADAPQLLGKLTAEIHQFSTSYFDMLKSGRLALNIAMTAWHMVDWVFADMDSDQRVRAGQILGGTIDKKSDLAALATKACDALRICQVIATASKHVEVANRPDPSLATRCELVNLSADDTNLQLSAVWVIEREGKEYPADQIFKDVHRFWENLLSDLGMIEDPIMGRSHRGW